MLKQIPDSLPVKVHGAIPPNRFWGYYTGPEIAAIGTNDPNATAVLNIGAVEQHGPHLPTVTDSLHGPELLGAALARLPDDVMVLGLPPTMYGKSEEHREWPGTLSWRGDTLRMVLRDIAASVARSKFSKFTIVTSHGGNVHTVDEFCRDLHIETGLRVFKIHLGSIAPQPGLVSPHEAAIGMHAGDGETSLIQHLAPQLVELDRAEGYIFDVDPTVGFSFKGQDAIEAWVSADLSVTGAIGNPHTASPAKGKQSADAKIARLAELLEAVYRVPKRQVRLAPTENGTATGARAGTTDAVSGG
ncbi:MAG: creatininase family protein [Chloroflexi bacterium]|nr:creatininase family protein [Chloroflexota bacterium]